MTKDPVNVIASSVFFDNVQQVEQGVFSIYASLQDVYDNHWKFTEQRSDNTTVQYWAANRGPHPIWLMEEFTMDASNQNIGPYWNALYTGIQRANTVIENIDNVDFFEPEVKNQLEGEAHFLRSLFYFHLVRLFGEVPLVLNQVVSPAESFQTIDGKASVNEVYNQIQTDVELAVDLLPSTNTNEDRGRVNKAGALTLMADVNMTLGDFAKAKTALNEVISMGYELLADYGEIFNPDNKNHSEAIFDVNYASLESNTGLGNTLIYNFAPWNSGSKITGYNTSTQGLNIPSIEILAAYEEGDLRKNESIGFFVDPSNIGQGIAMGDTILYIKKYAHAHPVQGRSGENVPIYRYAHVLLMLAECINELEGPTAEAYGFVNQVRGRAGLENLADGLSSDMFAEAVLHEMQVELAFENHRWFNILRKGKAMEVMNNHANLYRGRQTHFLDPAYVIEEYKFLYPIPQREITLNPNLTQNPGW
ncbi:RagB/SusD family nutrient uptake outer membrane protein [Membranihabitans marinus]